MRVVIKGLTFHSTRHTFATKALQAGATRHEVAGWLGDTLEVTLKKLFPWTEALVALVALKLQRACGEKSPLPLSAARDARPRLREHLEWSVEPTEPLRVTVSAPGLAAIDVTVSLDELRTLAARLEELGEREDERRRGAVSAGTSWS